MKDSINGLRPYLLKKVREGTQIVQTLEIFPSGESGYKKTMTIKELFTTILKEVESLESTSAKPLDLGGENIDHQSKHRKFSRNIRLHDLRNLEDRFSVHDEPSVRIRRHVVLISMNPIRVVVFAHKAIIIVPEGADSLLFLLQDHIHGTVVHVFMPILFIHI